MQIANIALSLLISISVLSMALTLYRCVLMVDLCLLLIQVNISAGLYKELGGRPRNVGCVDWVGLGSHCIHCVNDG